MTTTLPNAARLPAGVVASAATFAVLSLALISGPVPGLDLPDAGRVAMGSVYGYVAVVFLLAGASAPLWKRLEASLVAWAERYQWSQRELGRLVEQLAESEHPITANPPRRAVARAGQTFLPCPRSGDALKEALT